MLECNLINAFGLNIYTRESSGFQFLSILWSSEMSGIVFNELVSFR